MHSFKQTLRSVGAQLPLALATLLAAGAPAQAQVNSALTEQDYLVDLPIVLSVSRLAQRLDETPGAVTVIDRDMIRQSGARDVVDVLRLVPGFQTSTSFESVAPLASYHGKFDDYSNRIELLIDGRSAYSTYFIGSIGPGLQTVALEDVERIEVLRGSNSAAYGARAFLGVINIVTRHSADTLGGQGTLTVGENGVRDAQARMGWGRAGQSYRLTLDRRSDDGLAGANGSNQVDRMNFRADIPTHGGELQLRTGYFSIDAGKGSSSDTDKPVRPTAFSSGYVQMDYRLALGIDSDIGLRVAHSRESYHDEFPYALTNLSPLFSPADIYTVRFSGNARSDVLTLQHSLRWGDSIRVVWGGEYRNEQVQSSALFNTQTPLVSEFARLFGNVEWRFAPDWLLNAGAMAEHSSVSGDTLSPRVMLNWHVQPSQTLRVGASKAFRPPSAFEKSANLRYVWTGVPPFDLPVAVSSGQVQAETVVASEIGYLGEFKSLRASLDVRVFHEQINGFIRQDRSIQPADYYNSEDFAIKGVEYQLTWHPWRDARVILGQTHTHIGSTLAGTGTAYAAPKVASTLMFTQGLPAGWDVSLTHQDTSEMTLQGFDPKDRFAMTRTDLRLARAWRWGGKSTELALVIQNLGEPYRDFDPAFSFGRRAFVTLRLQE